jgi:hypothetical protein
MQNQFELAGTAIKVKCQIECCPQEALKMPRSFSIRYPEWLAVYLCPYHSNQLKLTGRVQGWHY